ncbi:MAG: hypothetical protein ACLUAO_03960 [Streptococcus sp.]
MRDSLSLFPASFTSKELELLVIKGKKDPIVFPYQTADIQVMDHYSHEYRRCKGIIYDWIRKVIKIDVISVPFMAIYFQLNFGKALTGGYVFRSEATGFQKGIG